MRNQNPLDDLLTAALGPTTEALVRAWARQACDEEPQPRVPRHKRVRAALRLLALATWPHRP